jgi:hypothetical protein
MPPISAAWFVLYHGGWLQTFRLLLAHAAGGWSQTFRLLLAHAAGAKRLGNDQTAE